VVFLFPLEGIPQGSAIPTPLTDPPKVPKAKELEDAKGLVMTGGAVSYTERFVEEKDGVDVEDVPQGGIISSETVTEVSD